ncbi:MAG: TetR/AcrR family transcriptional regulator [Rikenellaceae bacterium]
MENKQRRTRRTNEQIENEIDEAIKRLVEEKGFIDFPVTTIFNEAGVDPNAFYRRYKGLPEIYNEIARKYDFWVNDSIRVSDLAVIGDEEFMKQTLNNLYKHINENKIMQKLLLWELTEVNSTTQHTAQLRDTLNHTLLSYYNNSLSKSGLNTNCIFAILIAGIYYLILQRGIATFCLIDFSSEQGEKILEETIGQIVDMLYQKQEQSIKQRETIEKMLADRISKKKICHYLNLSMEDLKDF